MERTDWRCSDHSAATSPTLISAMMATSAIVAPGSARASTNAAEEALGRVEVAPGGEQEFDRLAVLVDDAVQVAPLAPDPNVGLVDAVAQVPGDRLDDQPASKWRPLKSFFDRLFSLAAMADRIMGAAEREAANSVGLANEPLTPEVCDRPPQQPSPSRVDRSPSAMTLRLETTLPRPEYDAARPGATAD